MYLLLLLCDTGVDICVLCRAMWVISIIAHGVGCVAGPAFNLSQSGGDAACAAFVGAVPYESSLEGNL